MHTYSASIEMISYYFHQISSFCCFNVLCCISHWWHLAIAGDPVMTRSLCDLVFKVKILIK